MFLSYVIKKTWDITHADNRKTLHYKDLGKAYNYYLLFIIYYDYDYGYGCYCGCGCG